jgi:hypothetical protein
LRQLVLSFFNEIIFAPLHPVVSITVRFSAAGGWLA